MGEEPVVVNQGDGAAVSVRLVCGCAVVWGGADAPYCETHRERRVSRVVAPSPRFTGVGCEPKGPVCHTER